ncbi:MAG: hypothetical protein ACOYPS_10480, partial [Phycisphaerales bacterium]
MLAARVADMLALSVMMAAPVVPLPLVTLALMSLPLMTRLVTLTSLAAFATLGAFGPCFTLALFTLALF